MGTAGSAPSTSCSACWPTPDVGDRAAARPPRASPRVARAPRSSGSSGAASRGLDAGALATLGIDLDEVRRARRARVRPRRAGPRPAQGPGARRSAPRAKKSLELALREAIALGDRSIGAEHVLLGLLREGDGVGGADPACARGRRAVAALGEALGDARPARESAWLLHGSSASSASAPCSSARAGACGTSEALPAAALLRARRAGRRRARGHDPARRRAPRTTPTRCSTSSTA